MCVPGEATAGKGDRQSHGFRRYPNLVKGMAITHLNQVWLSDITYIRTGFIYLAAILDGELQRAGVGSRQVYHRRNQVVVAVGLLCLCAQSMCVFKLSLSWQSY